MGTNKNGLASPAWGHSQERGWTLIPEADETDKKLGDMRKEKKEQPLENHGSNRRETSALNIQQAYVYSKTHFAGAASRPSHAAEDQA